MKHVAVLMGGWSAEREVSLRSGKACADALDRNGYRVTCIDVARDIAAVLVSLKPDVALNCLHGRPGEDGTIQGLLEDRKSTRLNSSHTVISYAVFCLKKKKKKLSPNITKKKKKKKTKK